MGEMRRVLCLLPLMFGLVFCGEGSDLPEDQVEEVLALYQKHCKSSYSVGGYGNNNVGGYSSSPSGSSNSGGYGSGPAFPNVHIVCKEGNEYSEPPKKQVIRIPAEKPKKQIVFVEAPQIKLKHEINVITKEQQAPRTVIYVLPQKATHSYQNLFKPGKVIDTKPSVFFLKNNHNNNNEPVPQNPSESYGVPSQPTTPRPIYGLPVENPKPIYGLPSQLMQSLDSSKLGPEYEVVSADRDTKERYQSFFEGVQNHVPQQSQIQPQQIQVKTHSSYPARSVALIRPSSFQQTPDSSFKNTFSLGTGGKLIFPSESIQNYQFQAFNGNKHESFVGVKPEEGDNDDELTDAQAAKSLKSLIQAYEERNRGLTLEEEATTYPPIEATTPTTTTTTTTTTQRSTTTREPYHFRSILVKEKKPERLQLNLFDEEFVRQLIANATSNAFSSSSSYNTNTDFSNRFRYVSPSNIFNSPQTFVPLPYQFGRPSNFNTKRSVDKPKFDFFPANFVSYSYTKIA